jgi:hypothetical protein
MDNIRSMVRQRILSTSTDSAMAHPHNDQGSFNEDFLDFFLEELIEQPENSLNRLSSFLSKKYFRPDGMAPLEWMRSIRAIRDTLEADYFAPGLNTMRRVAYRSPIMVSTFLLVLSVFYIKPMLWRFGQV